MKSATLNDHLLVYREEGKAVEEYTLEGSFKEAYLIEGNPDHVLLVNEGFSFYQKDFEDHFVNVSIFSLLENKIVAEEIFSGGLIGVVTSRDEVIVILNRGIGYVGTHGVNT